MTRLKAHVQKLAVDFAARNDNSPQTYTAAKQYIGDQLQQMGYEVTYLPVATARGTAYNIEASRKGHMQPTHRVVVGAHYDSHYSTPGADDNASGTAAALELARMFADVDPERALYFVFFANEEPPYFQRQGMGSAAYAKQLMKDPDVTVDVMFSLEMLGYYDASEGSQRYPAILSWFYPDTGDFIAFVSNLDHRHTATSSVRIFREQVDFPCYGFTGPAAFQGVDYSDHWSFWQAGYPAVMVTDTSFFRNPHYHKPTDTPDTLDFPRFTRVTHGLYPVIEQWTKASHEP